MLSGSTEVEHWLKMGSEGELIVLEELFPSSQFTRGCARRQKGAIPKKVVQIKSEEFQLLAHHVSILSLKHTKKSDITSFFLIPLFFWQHLHFYRKSYSLSSLQFIFCYF